MPEVLGHQHDDQNASGQWQAALPCSHSSPSTQRPQVLVGELGARQGNFSRHTEQVSWEALHPG
jgi:hypothetical protein